MEYNSSMTNDVAMIEIPIDKIRLNAKQPRKTFDDAKLDELAQSIAQDGIIEPVIVRPTSDGVYELVAGERRFRASVRAGLKQIPAMCREIDDKKAFEMALVENIQREDINPVECAYAYRHLMDEYGMTQEMIAGRVGKNRSTVANTLRLLNLPHEILDSLASGEISEGHARALLAAGDHRRQLQIWEAMKLRHLSVRETENLVRRMQDNPLSDEAVVSRETESRPKDPNMRDIEDRLRRYFGSKVTIEKYRNNKGRLIIEFYDDDDLTRILDLLFQ